MDKLNFLTAGIPSIARDYGDAFDKLNEMNLDGLEVEFVHGVRYSEKTRENILNRNNKLITHHGPYYINLNAKEEEKIQFNLKVASAKVTKSKSEVSGDTSIQTKLHDGKFMMAISDGMGSRAKS